MAKLSDLINTHINQNTITIQSVEIPVILTFEAFAYIEEAYGKEYHEFEGELMGMLEKGSVALGVQETKIINAMIYGMVRAGGTECTFDELRRSIPIADLPAIFQTTLDIFNKHIFQSEDFAKIKSDEKK